MSLGRTAFTVSEVLLLGPAGRTNRTTAVASVMKSSMPDLRPRSAIYQPWALRQGPEALRLQFPHRKDKNDPGIQLMGLLSPSLACSETLCKYQG